MYLGSEVYMTSVLSELQDFLVASIIGGMLDHCLMDSPESIVKDSIDVLRMRRIIKMKIKNNEFKCVICQQTRQRGVFVHLGKKVTDKPGWSGMEGILVKVCKSAECKKFEKKGDLDAVVTRHSEVDPNRILDVLSRRMR